MSVTGALTPGTKCGHLVTLKPYQHNGGNRWSCWCDCGAFVFMPEWRLLRGYAVSCGDAAKHPKAPKKKRTW